MNGMPPIQIDPKTFLKRHQVLPALPSMVFQIEDQIKSQTGEINSIAELISSDPALVAQVLKVVNSAYYGLPREVASVKYAVAYLGLSEIHKMVLTLYIVKTLDIKDQASLDAYWEHSLLTALCAKHLAKQHEPLLPYEDIGSAAILHDIGKLVYIKFFPDHYKALVQYCRDNGTLFSEAEKALAFPKSNYLGVLLCDHWNLPERMRMACEFHSRSDLQRSDQDIPDKDFCRVICLANLLATLAADPLNDSEKDNITTTIMTTMEYDESEFLNLMGKVYELREEVNCMK